MLKEGDNASHGADGARNTCTLRRVKKGPVQLSSSWDGICGLGQDFQQHHLHGPPGEPFRPPRWGAGWRDSPSGSGEDTDAEDASGKV